MRFSRARLVFLKRDFKHNFEQLLGGLLGAGI